MSQYLYIIKCQEFYKIGVANDVESRLAQLSTGNPYQLSVEVLYEFQNADPVERAIHQKFFDKRTRGEWFSLGYDDLKDIHKICLLLGASAYEYTGKNATDDDIAEAEEIQETNFVSYNPDTMRTEIRMANGDPRGVAIVTRSTPKRAIAYIGKTNPEFEKYLHIYKQEHPESKVF